MYHWIYVTIFNEYGYMKCMNNKYINEIDIIDLEGSLTNTVHENDAGEFINGMMNMVFQPEIRHIGVRHASKYLWSPVKYINTDEYKQHQQKKSDDEFFKSLRLHPNIQRDPVMKMLRKSKKKKFKDKSISMSIVLSK